MYNIEAIHKHQKLKIETLLTDRVDEVVSEFKTKLQTMKVDHARVLKALDFALAQDYGSGELVKFYVTHPIRLSIFIMDWMNHHQDYSTEFLEAALIHNAIEKGIMEKDELESQYGKWIAHTVAVLTQDREAMKNPLEKEKYYQRIYELDQKGQLLKFFDKFDNLYAICLNPNEETRKNYIQEIADKVRGIGLKFAPETIPYFDALTSYMLKMGHYYPKF